MREKIEEQCGNEQFMPSELGMMEVGSDMQIELLARKKGTNAWFPLRIWFLDALVPEDRREMWDCYGLKVFAQGHRSQLSSLPSEKCCSTPHVDCFEHAIGMRTGGNPERTLSSDSVTTTAVQATEQSNDI